MSNGGVELLRLTASIGMWVEQHTGENKSFSMQEVGTFVVTTLKTQGIRTQQLHVSMATAYVSALQSEQQH